MFLKITQKLLYLDYSSLRFEVIFPIYIFLHNQSQCFENWQTSNVLVTLWSFIFGTKNLPHLWLTLFFLVFFSFGV